MIGMGQRDEISLEFVYEAYSNVVTCKLGKRNAKAVPRLPNYESLIELKHLKRSRTQ
jgi:hypothetical protein